MTSSTAPNQLTGLEIAIIGMAGRFPGAPDLDALWRNLRDGVESISFFSDAELLAAGVDPAAIADPRYVKAGGALAQAERFDAAFFGYSPREAALIDPQQRLFLELSWQALEHACCDPETYSGQIGVFGGVSLNRYWLNLYTNRELRAMTDGFQGMISNDRDFLTTRVSYKLNLTGPSVTVQTSCSTSLVAVHMACQSLLSGGCDIALAGGSSIGDAQSTGYWYQEGGIQSPDGHCRAFDAQARGTVSGNGVGVIVLKRLDDALADRDSIHAVIKGSAINNDGSLKVGYTAPSIDGQVKVIRAAQLMAEIEPDTIGYVEAHGTGTPVGDPIEITALARAFGEAAATNIRCAIGSIKTNIGHLDAAAGIAGLIKTVLALKHRQIPPSLHFQTPNPQIDFASSRFYVNTSLAEWKTNGAPRRAGVSSFGIGGTNAHAILEESPARAPSDPARPWQLLLLSARTGTALEQATDNLIAYLRESPEVNLADVAYTLQVGRRAFNQRRVVVCRDRDEAIALLENRDARHVLTAQQEPQERSVVFLFPGQGAQYAGMARDLYDSEPVLRAAVDRCAELLRPHLGLDLRDVLYPERTRTTQQAEVVSQQLDQTWLAQPALFVIEYALAQLWISQGVRPGAMLGHSIGEYVAACLAGVFSLEDALRLVAARGRMMQQLPGGAMLGVPLAEAALRPLLGPALDLAAINGPASCVVSGSQAAIAGLRERLAAQGIESRVLHTSHAFHSAAMDAIIAPFGELVSSVRRSPPQIPYLSNLTGTWISAAEATDPRYWARHLRETVYFADGIRELARLPDQILLEVGPGQTLATFARQQLGSDSGRVVLASLRHPQDQHPDRAVLLRALGQLWLSGASIDWAAHGAERRQRLPLPTYPFERERYWIDGRTHDAAPVLQDSHPRRNSGDWLYIPSWKRSVPAALYTPESLAANRRGWLIFVDQLGLGARLAQRLEQGNQHVVSVTAGEHFARLGERSYMLRPHQRDDYRALLQAIHTNDQPLTHLVHMWSITTADPTLGTDQRLCAAQEHGFNSLLLLTQALEARSAAERLEIAVVANDTQDVNGETLICPEKTTILALCNALPQEYPHLSCRSIDVVPPATQDERVERLADTLIAELATPTRDTTIAYRGSYRWVQTFEPVASHSSAVEQSRLRPGGAYLIFGALAGNGAILAEHLARTTQASIALILPHTARQADATPQALQDFGAQALLAHVDLGDLEAVRGAVDRIQQQFGPIHGIIAAILAAEPAPVQAIQELDTATCEHSLHDVARRFAALQAVVQATQPDFCLVLSSSDAVLGDAGSAASAATSLLLDGYVYRSGQSGALPWLSVSWETRPEEQAITPGEAAHVFQQIFTLGQVPQVVVSTRDLTARSEARSRPAASETAEPVATQLAYARPRLQSTYVAPTNEIERRLAGIWQQIFGIDQVGIHDNFFELGGDSLLATQLTSRLRDDFQIEVPLRDLFATSTIAELALLVAQQLLAQIDLDLLDEIAD